MEGFTRSEKLVKGHKGHKGYNKPDMRKTELL